MKRHALAASYAALALSLALPLAACGPAEQPETAATRVTPAMPEPATPPVAPQADANTLTPQGLGPLHVGMTLAEVEAAMGPDANPGAVGGPDPESCDEFRPANAPEGVLVMIEQGRLARISLVDPTPIRTSAGFSVGRRRRR
jgi:hypothetical protein